ncbi:hypothetical protein ACIBJI_25805 [Nocardia sp. NPDC050408]|uniref:hypothetical protein n=1 Tax=unclassified Nocardia TaxID=2637762 RepID=UPI00341DE8B1
MKAATVAAPERIARQPDSGYRRVMPWCACSASAYAVRIWPSTTTIERSRAAVDRRPRSAIVPSRVPQASSRSDADRAWMRSTPGKCWIRLG